MGLDWRRLVVSVALLALLVLPADATQPQQVVALTSASGSSWALPASWPGFADAIYVIGAGGNGNARQSSTRGGAGGGGGAEVQVTSAYTMTTAPAMSIGAAGSAANTTFNSSAFIAAHGTTGGAGGTTANSTVPAGGTKSAGGAGLVPATSTAYGGGGGGSAGPSGAGGNAASDVGGSCDNGAVAAPTPATTSPQNGLSGTEWTATVGGTYGCGTGGTGASSGTHAGALGGVYGGGASGASDGSAASAGGNGGGGLIIIKWTPGYWPTGYIPPSPAAARGGR